MGIQNLMYKQLLKTLKTKLEKEFEIEPKTFVVIKQETSEQLVYMINDKQQNVKFPKQSIDLFEAKIKEAIQKDKKLTDEITIINNLIIEFDFENDLISCICKYNNQFEFELTM